jgi:RHS repeat-associated protein
VTDHHHTAEIMLRHADMQLGRKRTTPFGDLRGAAAGFWTGDKGFVGGTDDPAGLTHLGARMYDQTLGRFTQTDPLIDYFEPQQMHGYAYANNAPPTYTDPDGLIFRQLAKAATSTVSTVTNVQQRVANTVTNAAATAGRAVANFAKDTANTIKEDPWKFAAQVAVGVAITAGVAVLCAATAGIGCGVGAAIVAGALAGSASAGVGYGIEVARGEREHNWADLATELVVGAIIGGALGGAAGVLGKTISGRIASTFGKRTPTTQKPPTGTTTPASNSPHPNAQPRMDLNGLDEAFLEANKHALAVARSQSPQMVSTSNQTICKPGQLTYSIVQPLPPYAVVQHPAVIDPVTSWVYAIGATVATVAIAVKRWVSRDGLNYVV